MATEFTPNYNLDKYTAQDKPNLRDQYNAAMDKIDLALLSANTNATEAKAATQGFQTQLNAKASKTEVAADIAEAVQPLATKTALQNETTARQTADTNLGNRISALEKPYFAVIGDSFSDQTSEWTNIVKANTGFNLLNGATAGGTFGTNSGNKQFITQLNNISGNENWSKVHHLIVYGGVNDWTDLNESASTTLGFVDDFISTFKSLSHRPKITFVFGNCGAPNRSFTRTYLGYPTYVNAVVKGIRERGFDAVPAYAWLLGYDNSRVFNSDNLHPNGLGEKIIASFMTSILNGSYNGFVRQITASPTEDNFTGNLFINIYDTYASAAFKAKTINAIPSTGTSFNPIFRLQNNIWFGTDTSSAVTKIELLHRCKNALRIISTNNTLNLVEAYSNIAVTNFGFVSNTDIDVIAGFTFHSDYDILIFE